MKKNSKYDLGIIGGMGSEATVEIFNRIISNTKHEKDQDFMRICILNDSVIPDRSKAILEGGESPIPYLNEDIKRLKKIGVRYFIVPCNTAHYFVRKMSKKGIDFIDMIFETLKFIEENYQGKKVCLLATTGTVESGVYFSDNKIPFIKLDNKNQNKVMNVITKTKEIGVTNESLNDLSEVINSVLKNINKEEVVFILGCTELSLYLKELKEINVVDAMDVLVNKAIEKCGYSLK